MPQLNMTRYLLFSALSDIYVLPAAIGFRAELDYADGYSVVPDLRHGKQTRSRQAHQNISMCVLLRITLFCA